MYDLEDREKVRELFARYCHAIDARDRYEEWISLFTRDAIVRSSVSDPIEGHAGLRNFTEQLANSAFQHIQMRHIIENLVMDLGSDHGTAECTLTVWHTAKGETRIYLLGTYKAKVRKVDREWYFHELDQVIDTAIGQVNLEP